jgi:hypothetical protein
MHAESTPRTSAYLRLFEPLNNIKHSRFIRFIVNKDTLIIIYQHTLPPLTLLAWVIPVALCG